VTVSLVLPDVSNGSRGFIFRIPTTCFTYPTASIFRITAVRTPKFRKLHCLQCHLPELKHCFIRLFSFYVFDFAEMEANFEMVANVWLTLQLNFSLRKTKVQCDRITEIEIRKRNRRDIHSIWMNGSDKCLKFLLHNTQVTK
jgi:hypothetical protein